MLRKKMFLSHFGELAQDSILASFKLACIHAYSVFGSRGTDIRFKICIRFLAFRSAVESYTPQKVFVVVVFVVFKY